MTERQKPVILNVNDLEATLYATSRVLKKAGYDVWEARMGEEALRLVADEPDLVLLDVNLPDILGFDVCRRIKDDPRTAVIPVIHVSATYRDEISRLKGLTSGADGYLTMPVEPQVLVAYVKALLRLHRAEAQALGAARRWQATFDSILDGVCLLDGNGRVLSCNKTMPALMGQPVEEIVGQVMDDWLLGEQDGPSPFALAIEYRRRVSREVPRDGRWLRYSVDPLGAPDGEVRGAVCTVTDITDQKRGQEEEKIALRGQLFQGQKLESIGRLAGGVAHDFNNLLTAISGYAGFALRDLPQGAPESIKDDLQGILRAAERAAGLTRQLLTFSRRQVFEPRVMNLNLVIQDAANMLTRMMGEYITLKTEFAPDLNGVRADCGQIEELLLNLALNSRDAMPDGGTLTIRTANVVIGADFARSHISALPGEYASFSVADTGAGMTQDVKDHLFEPFFTTKEFGRGTGMGLSTVYGIVRQHDGFIDVESEPGAGTTFTVYLPTVKEQPTAEDSCLHDLDVRPGGTETVLLVEDEPMVREVTERTLSELGYTVLAAPSGPRALEMIESRGEPADLVVTDLVMPGMNGRELVERLLERYPDTRVLFLSGYAPADILPGHLLADGKHYLPKPCTPIMLARKVRALLDS